MLRSIIIAAGVALALANPADAAPPEPSVPQLHFVFEERVDLGSAEATGEIPHGQGNRIPLLGGKVAGPQLQGSVVGGGSDWQLLRTDGCSEIVADYFIRAQDGTLIYVRNLGLARARGDGLTVREIVYLQEREWAACAQDVLWRRTKLGLRFTPSQVEQLEAWFTG
jgi:glycerol-3-phosphate dehydrogenase